MTHTIDSEDLPTNLSHNEHFQQVVQRAVNRRGFLFKSGVGAAAVAFMSAGLTGCGGGDDTTVSAPVADQPLLGFAAIATYTDDGIRIAPGYTATPFLPWGTPLFSTGAGATWVGDASENAAAQARQIGDNHDGIHYFAIDGKSDEGLLVMNHEYTNLQYLFTDGQVNSLDDAHKDLNAHGVSVVHIRRTGGVWSLVVDSRYTRRITGNTPMLLTGPAAGDALMTTTADPTGTVVLGTLNNCGNGWTPWGTYLTCEENFNQYFGTTDTSAVRNTNMARYGLPSGATSRRYESYISRFD
ncbi:MAG: PhoX family protein, partial [Hydrogenophaga sp.]|uniref:PhoX family protein n=1 Tax=Hydrogenophaga sp. TaxID=1904254 RepID=UPI003D9B8E30